jgi:3-oxoadipate enol-lactonase
MSFAVNDGVRIYWRETGSGEPLLLIMGLGYPSEMWHHVEGNLAEHFRVILFDNRGIGRSSSSPGPHLIPDLAADAAAVLDAAGVEAAHVFGMSLGGFIAQEFVLRYPHRTRALVLGCTAFGGERVVPAAPEVLEKLAARAHMSAEEGIHVMVPHIYDASTPAERVDADLAIRLRTYPSPETYLAQIEGAGLWSSHDRLGEIRSPTLVIHGTSDELITPENGRMVAERIPGAILYSMEQASHMFTTDKPQESSRLVTDFLQRHSAIESP